MAPDTSVNKPSTRVTLTRATPTLYNQSTLPQLQIRTQVHHGLILKRAMLAFSTSNTVQCDSGKAKTFQKPYTHAPLIPPPSSWKQPFLGMKDLALDFPVPHFLTVITRTSHSCIIGMDNKEIIMKSNTEPLCKPLHILKSETIRVPCRKQLVNAERTHSRSGPDVPESKNSLLP